MIMAQAEYSIAPEASFPYFFSRQHELVGCDYPNLGLGLQNILGGGLGWTWLTAIYDAWGSS